MSHRGRFSGAWCACCLALVGPAEAAEPLRFDGRDQYTLFDRHLQTRQLRLQLEQPDQRFRIARDWELLRAAADVAIGTQQTYGYGSQTHFHGFAIADTFLSLQFLPELDVTLNLLAYNPSASDGYRVSAVIKPGIALDARTDLLRIAGRPLRFGVSGTDLGVITLGEGLLFEQGQVEGVLGWLDYGGVTYSYLYAGRALWADDDLIRHELSLFGERLRFMLVQWQTTYALRNPQEPPALSNVVQERNVTHYADVTLDLPLWNGFRTALEYALRFRDPPRSAALLRADWLRRDLGPLDVHVGYQFRFYQHGIAPRNFDLPPTVELSFPYQEDSYVTNPFEYLGLSERFEQWSHTLMLEGRLELRRNIEIFASSELWQRAESAVSRPAPQFPARERFGAPWQRLSAYYSAGISFYPWPPQPHRADVMITNKQVPGQDEVASFQRFTPGRYYVLRLKAFF